MASRFQLPIIIVELRRRGVEGHAIDGDAETGLCIGGIAAGVLRIQRDPEAMTLAADIVGIVAIGETARAVIGQTVGF